MEDNIAAGVTPEDAPRDALVRFGNRVATRERVAGMDAALALESIGSDVWFACRQLVRNPGFTITAIVVLALGIGASVAIFAFVDAALIKPLPYKDPARLVSVYEVVNTCPLCNISYQNYQDWRKSNLPFSSIEAWGWASYLLRNAETTDPVRGARVSYSRTRGIFAGVDLNGAVVSQNVDDTDFFYGGHAKPYADILQGNVPVPRPARSFVGTVARYFRSIR